MGWLSDRWDAVRNAVKDITNTIKTIVKETLKGHFGEAFKAYGQMYVDTVITGGDTVENIMKVIGIKDQTVTSGDFSAVFPKEKRTVERKDADGNVIGHPVIDTGFKPNEDILIKSALQNTDYLDSYVNLYKKGFRWSYPNTVAYARKFYKNGLPDFTFAQTQADYTEASMLAEIIKQYPIQYGVSTVFKATDITLKESLYYPEVPVSVSVLQDISHKYPFNFVDNTLDYNGAKHRVFIDTVTAHPDKTVDALVHFIKDEDDTESLNYTYHYTPRGKVFALIAVSGGKFPAINDYLIELDPSKLVKENRKLQYEAAPVLLIRENKVWIDDKPSADQFRKGSSTVKELYREYKLGETMGFDVGTVKDKLSKQGGDGTLQTAALSLMASIESEDYYVKYYIYEYFKWLRNKVSYDSSKYLYYGYGEATECTLTYRYTAASTHHTYGMNGGTTHTPESKIWQFTFKGLHATLTINTGHLSQFEITDLKGSLGFNWFEDSAGHHPSTTPPTIPSGTAVSYKHKAPLTINEGDLVTLISKINAARSLVKEDPRPWSMDDGGSFFNRYKDRGLKVPLISSGNSDAIRQNVTNFKEGHFNFNYNMQYVVEHTVRSTKKSKKSKVEIPINTGLNGADLVIRKYTKGSYDYKELVVKFFNQNSFIFIAGTNSVHLSVASREHKNMCVPILKQVLHKVPYPWQEAILSRSPCIITYAGTFQELRYYQTKQFQMLAQAVIIIVSIIAMNPEGVVLSDLLFQIAVMKAVEFVFDELIKEFGDHSGIATALVVLKSIVMVAAGNAVAGGSFTLTGSDLLAVTTQATQNYGKYEEYKLRVIGEEAAKVHSDYLKTQHEADEIKDYIDSTNANLAKAGLYVKWMMDNPPIMEYADEFHARVHMDVTEAATNIDNLIG